MSARAIVLAAGKGMRMKSERPKVLHEICGRPMLWWGLEALRRAGVAEITVVTSTAIHSSARLFIIGAASIDQANRFSPV